jgi:hypothetical protein
VRLGALAAPGYRPLFSGHETFPLRHGWLKKVYEAVRADDGIAPESNPFEPAAAIARFGVGKNMVVSMRHWAVASGIITDPTEGAPGNFGTTRFADLLFGENADPYLEDPASTWMLHWRLAGGESDRPIKTSLYWLFSAWNGGSFTRDELTESLLKLSSDQEWRRVSKTTVQRDVDCLLRSYVSGDESSDIPEESVESQLAELRLLSFSRGRYALANAQRRTLPDEVFLHALMSFWQRHSTSRAITIEAVMHAPSSPGRVFVMREDEVVERLQKLEMLTGGAIAWSETSGLRQVVRTSDSWDPMQPIQSYFASSGGVVAA